MASDRASRSRSPGPSARRSEGVVIVGVDALSFGAARLRDHDLLLNLLRRHGFGLAASTVAGAPVSNADQLLLHLAAAAYPFLKESGALGPDLRDAVRVGEVLAVAECDAAGSSWRAFVYASRDEALEATYVSDTDWVQFCRRRGRNPYLPLPPILDVADLPPGRPLFVKAFRSPSAQRAGPIPCPLPAFVAAAQIERGELQLRRGHDVDTLQRYNLRLASSVSIKIEGEVIRDADRRCLVLDAVFYPFFLSRAQRFVGGLEDVRIVTGHVLAAALQDTQGRPWNALVYVGRGGECLYVSHQEWHEFCRRTGRDAVPPPGESLTLNPHDLPGGRRVEVTALVGSSHEISLPLNRGRRLDLHREHAAAAQRHRLTEVPEAEQLALATDAACSVCLESLQTEALYRTACAHVFHRACIVPWVLSHHSCPLCRSAT